MADIEEGRILVVDADAGEGEVVRQALPNAAVTVAPNGYQALARINLQAFDLYVLDYWLPDWSGPALCRYIRARDPHVPVIFSTLAGGPRDEARARRAGASDYLQKPVGPATLRHFASRLLRQSELRNARAQTRAQASVRDELDRRFNAIGAVPSMRQFEQALHRVARIRARDAFCEAGGTLCGFEHTWGTLWQAACERTHCNPDGQAAGSGTGAMPRYA